MHLNHNLLHINIDLVLIKGRDCSKIALFLLPSFAPLMPCILHLYRLQTPKYSVIPNALYNLVSFKEVKGRNEENTLGEVSSLTHILTIFNALHFLMNSSYCCQSEVLFCKVY